VAEKPSFQDVQYAFAAHIRDPGRHDPPVGIEDRRMAIYRRLFFDNVSHLLSRTFPVLFKVMGRQRWEALVRDYFSHHEAHTPLFMEMPREFLRYLEKERGKVSGDLPFQYELAHYEWVELALSIEEAEPDLNGIEAEGDLLDGRPEISPLVWSLQYRYPVHRISPENQPSEPPDAPTFLVVYRNQQDRIGFLEINAVTARLIELLVEGDVTSGREALVRIAGELDHPQPQTVIDGGISILGDLRRRQVVLGTRKKS